MPRPARKDGVPLLALTPKGQDRYLADANEPNHTGKVFGGQLLGQSILAAIDTVQRLPVSSLHAYFLASGMIGKPLEYSVTRLRDSRRFANRLVMVEQDGRPIFMLACEFHEAERGFEHQSAAMPDVPPPEAVRPLQEVARAHLHGPGLSALENYARDLPIEIRPVAPERYFAARPERPERDMWIRVPQALATGDPREQQAFLAFASDYWLGGASAIPHTLPANSDDLLILSLDHAIWFHRPAHAGEWLLHSTSSPSAGGGLGFVQGRIFDRAGRLIASTAQECLIRPLA